MQKLRLIGERTVTEVRFGDTVFRVRPLSHEVARDLRRQCMANGRFDEERFERLVFERSLVGWEALASTDGHDVPFAQDRIADVLLALPEMVVQRLSLEAQSATFAVEEARKNSEPSSPSERAGT